ncbi:hypothetical protein BRC94_00585 [Halobacteriales archaeon QS_5_70_17]|nr:MAG: hypothetical protein BRC94_00585 [Halobacteriales archaeon QS_5_70_17]
MTALDRVFDLLSEERRRYALYYLANREGAVPVADLAEAVADWETLQHDHLPKASEAEFVEYDADEGVVRTADAPREYEAVVAVARLIEQPDDGGSDPDLG